MRLIPPVAAFLAMTATAIAQPQTGTIRGRVLDPDGQPMRDVQVTVIQDDLDYKNKSFRSVAVDADGKFQLTTPAGRIMLSAQPRAKIVGSEPKSRRFVTHPPAYFPGVLDRIDAWPIDIKAGEVVELDFHMPSVSVGSIKTIISGPEGYSLDYVRVTRPEANQIKSVKLLEDGVGYTDNLREGRYIVSARGQRREALLAAWDIVYMTAGEVAVTLDLKPAARVYGRIMPDRDGLPPLAGVRVVAAWTDGTIDLDPLGRDEGQVSADGSFTIDGLFGTRTFRVAGLDSGWQVVAVRQGRSDISSGIELAPGTTIEIAIVVTRK